LDISNGGERNCQTFAHLRASDAPEVSGASAESCFCAHNKLRVIVDSMARVLATCVRVGPQFLPAGEQGHCKSGVLASGVWLFEFFARQLTGKYATANGARYD